MPVAVELPPREAITVHFAHLSGRFEERFALRDTGSAHFQTWNAEDAPARVGEADVLVGRPRRR